MLALRVLPFKPSLRHPVHRALPGSLLYAINGGMSDSPTVISIGEALWDVFCHGGDRCTRRIGGAPANFAYHVAQQGVSACALSAIGQDASGDDLAAALAAAGAPCRLRRVPFATGEVRIVLEEGGIPCYDIRPDAAWDHLEATPELVALMQRAKAVCFGSLAQRADDSRAAIASLLQAAPQGDACLRVFDVNLRCGFYTPAIIRDSLQMANVLKLNEEEMEILGRMEGLRGLPQLEQARLLMERYSLRLLILTCGAIGSYVLGQGGDILSYRATPVVHVVDTVGAGDSFTATFIAGLLRGLSVPEAHAAAVRVAACVCTQPGAMPEIPAHLRLASSLP